MIKHVILWKLKENLTNEEKKTIKENAKRELEALEGKIEGLESIRVETESLDSSTADMMLDSVFADEKALASYSKNPLHCKAADTYVRPFTALRMCLNYRIGD